MAPKSVKNVTDYRYYGRRRQARKSRLYGISIPRYDDLMKSPNDWKTQAKQLIRAEMKRRSLSYGDLASRMQELGLSANERTLANKIAAGGFSAAFFLQCMEAIGVKGIQLEN